MINGPWNLWEENIMDIENVDYGEKLEDGKQELSKLVQTILDKDGIDYIIEDHELKKCFKYSCDRDDKHIDIEIWVWLGYITIKCIYPFLVQRSDRACMALLISEINNNKNKPFVKFDIETGMIYVENSVITYGCVDLDERVISGEILISIDRTFSYFENLCSVINGNLTKDQRDNYRALLFSGLSELDEHEILNEDEFEIGKNIGDELPFC